MTHAPDYLRQTFIDLVDGFNVEGEEITLKTKLEDRDEDASWLLGQLWNCTDIMPHHTCTAIDDVCDIYNEMPQGSTYAQGARLIKMWVLNDDQ